MDKLFKKYYVYIILVFLVVAGGIFFIYPSRECYSMEGVEMTIPYKILIGDNFNKKIIKKSIKDVFLKIDQIFNNWNSNSELSCFNRLGKNIKFHLSNELTEFLSYIFDLVEFTEGRYDPTVASLQKLWLTYLKQGQVPSNEEISHLRSSIGYDKLVFNKQAQTLEKKVSCLEIDLCGSVKGYAVDLLFDKFKALGLKNFYISWGGEIKVKGKHPKNRPWFIFVPKKNLVFSMLDNEALASSGNYIQKWPVQGEVYTHILNPISKELLKISKTGVEEVTVKHEQCFIADALATALMLFSSKEEAESWAIKKGINAWF